MRRLPPSPSSRRPGLSRAALRDGRPGGRQRQSDSAGVLDPFWNSDFDGVRSAQRLGGEGGIATYELLGNWVVAAWVVRLPPQVEACAGHEHRTEQTQTAALTKQGQSRGVCGVEFPMVPKPGQSSAVVALVRAGRRRATASLASRSSADQRAGACDGRRGHGSRKPQTPSQSIPTHRPAEIRARAAAVVVAPARPSARPSASHAISWSLPSN